jgi:hypothetical protein
MESSVFTALSNSRLVFGLLTFVGMAMCSAGIGKAARLGLWLHPITILGYLLGVAALLLAAQGLARWQVLPLSNEQVLLSILAIIVVKIMLARFYGV